MRNQARRKRITVGRRFGRLHVFGILVALGVLIAGGVTVLSRQSAAVKGLKQPETSSVVMLNKSTEGLIPVQHPDGSMSVDLQGRFKNVTVARVNKDGSVSQSCVDNPRSAGAFFGIDPKLIESAPDQPRIKPIKN